jgi:hypothetical protein
VAAAEAAAPLPPPGRHPLAEKILAGDAEKAIRLTAARGSLPLPLQDLLYIQVCLLKDDDPEVIQEATASLEKTQVDTLGPLFRDSKCDPVLLDHFARSGKLTGGALEAAVAHPATPDPTLEHLAASGNTETLNLLVTNEVRIIKNPRLLELLRGNANLAPENRRRLAELERDFVGKEYEKVREAPTPVQQPAEMPEETDVLDIEIPPEQDVPFMSPEDEAGWEEDLRSTPAFQKIMKMTVSERLQLAMKGRAEERAILIRDTAKLVAMQVLKSPKLNDQEICNFANMRNVTEDVLRKIGSKRDWTKHYTIAHALVRNPKTPPGIAMPFLPRLGTRDLKTLAGDKNVPELLRRQARNIFLARTQPPKKTLVKKGH